MRSIGLWAALAAASAPAQDPPAVEVAPPPRDIGALEVVPPPPTAVQYHVAVDGTGALHMVFSESAGSGPIGRRAATLFHTVRAPGAGEWSTPVRVNRAADVVKAASYPRIAVGRDGRVHIAWATMINPVGQWYARAQDDGAGFEPERNLAAADARGIEVGPALAADADGNVFVVWHEGAFKDEERRRVVLRRSSNDGKSFGPPQTISPRASGVCACCGLTAALDPAGPLYVAYRAAGDKVHRDMTLLKSVDGGKTFAPTTVDRWEFGACPTSMAAIATCPGVGAVLSWETKGQAFFAPIDQLERRVAAPAATAGQQKLLALAVDADGRVLFAWTEGQGGGGRLHWQVFGADGAPTGAHGTSPRPLAWHRQPFAVTRPDGGFALVF